jgi:hypothetical protein
MAAAESVSRIVSIEKQMFVIFAKPLFKRSCMLYYTDNEQMFLRRFSMKILGLLLVLGIGIFLIWFFEEIFKAPSEEEYTDCEYEMPHRAVRTGTHAVRARISARRVGTSAVKAASRTSYAGARAADGACGSGQEVLSRYPVYSSAASAGNLPGRAGHGMTRIPSGEDRRYVNGQSSRKSA